MPRTHRKNSRSTVDRVVAQTQCDIDDNTNDLSDGDYLEALEQIESYVKSCITAKREEMEK